MRTAAPIMRRIGVGVAALAIAASFGACSSSSSSSKATATGTSSTAVATTPGAASSSELEKLLIDVAPDGFRLQPDKVGDTGPSDLAKAVKDDGTPTAAAALRSEKFVRGYQRLWVGPNDAEVIVFVYQFADDAGAQKDFARDKTALRNAAPPRATPFAVDGIPAGSTAAIAGTAPETSAAIVLFHTGPYNAQIVSNGPVLAPLQARAGAIALQQYQRLHSGG